MPVMNALIIAASGILVVFLMLVLLWMIIVGINKTVIAIEKTEEKPAEKAVKARPVPVQEIKPAPAPAAAPAPAPAAAPAAVSAPAYSVQTADSGIYGGNIAVFDDIDDKTVACIMAIISDETKIPLNQLIFKSIRLVQE